MTLRLPLIFATALLLTACGDDSTTPEAAPADTAPGQAGTPAPATPETPAAREDGQDPAEGRGGFGPHDSADARADAGMTGVAECDTFLSRYEACMTKVPEEARGGMQTAVASWRGTWKSMAASPTTRGQLQAICQSTADSIREQLTAQGCTP